jgi:hypothetical protein
VLALPGLTLAGAGAVADAFTAGAGEDGALFIARIVASDRSSETPCTGVVEAGGVYFGDERTGSGIHNVPGDQSLLGKETAAAAGELGGLDFDVHYGGIYISQRENRKTSSVGEVVGIYLGLEFGLLIDVLSALRVASMWSKLQNYKMWIPQR